MKAEVIKITPELAENFLRFNKNNRKISEKRLKLYVDEMKGGRWQENGESIIIDSNGNIKDGQHRLKAIVSTKQSYNFVVVRDVHPSVMKTIDTGKNRSLSDVLHLNNFKYAPLLASTARKIYLFKKGTNLKSIDFSNSIGFEFVSDNEEMLYSVITPGEAIYKKQPYKILNASQISFFLYVVSGGYPNETHIDFLKHLIGVRVKESNSASWLFKKILNARNNKELMNEKWLTGMVIKAWNNFVDGDPAIRSMSFNVDADYPKVNSCLV